jgi:CheY-like chemotaxis protein
LNVQESAKGVRVSMYLEQKQVNILLIGDNLDGLAQIRQVLQQTNIKNRLHVVGNPCEAMAYLLRKAPYTNAPKPDLVLLSVSLPPMSRVDVQVELNTNPEFAEVDVVMLKGSGHSS